MSNSVLSISRCFLFPLNRLSKIWHVLIPKRERESMYVLFSRLFESFRQRPYHRRFSLAHKFTRGLCDALHWKFKKHMFSDNLFLSRKKILYSYGLWPPLAWTAIQRQDVWRKSSIIVPIVALFCSKHSKDNSYSALALFLEFDSSDITRCTFFRPKSIHKSRKCEPNHENVCCVDFLLEVQTIQKIHLWLSILKMFEQACDVLLVFSVPKQPLGKLDVWFDHSEYINSEAPFSIQCSEKQTHAQVALSPKGQVREVMLRASSRLKISVLSLDFWIKSNDFKSLALLSPLLENRFWMLEYFVSSLLQK